MFTETQAALSRLGLRRSALALEVLAWTTLALLGAMVLLVVASMPQERGTTAQIVGLASDSLLYRLAFVAAALVNPVFLAALALFSWLEHRRRSLRPVELVGWAFLVAYLPLVLVAYVSQFTVFPMLAGSDPAMAEMWYFYSDTSLPFLIDVVGYAMFGIGAVLISTVLVRRHGIVGWVGRVLLLAGAFSIAGLVGMAAGLEVVAYGTSMGGMLIAPLAILLAVDGRVARSQ
ncbi:MAG TPA: hypothetical protein VIY70_02595 [Acidimicrobiia bacterium]